MAHTWKFFRAGGFDQVSLTEAADLLNLKELDQKLWVALSCPTRGVEFDARTLALIDSDGDGYIRAPELLAAIDWAAGQVLPEQHAVFAQRLPGVPLEAIANEAWRSLAQSLCGLQDKYLTPDAVVAAEARAQAEAEAAWANTAPADAESLAAAVAATDAVAAKLDDFFTRCALAAFDARAAEPLAGTIETYAALGGGALAPATEGLAALPLAKVGAGGTAPLAGSGLNPAWAGAISAFAEAAVAPLLGAREALSESDWRALQARLAPWRAWQEAKPAGLPESAAALADLERLSRYVRDLLPLANNFVAFRAFYQRSGKGMFQVGTLYLDGRSAELCVAADNAAPHAALAGHSRMCLVYCDCQRSGEKRSIAAAFTAGDADQLMVGRNGVFYDRQGNDWQATITKIVDQPISLRQAFWSPYRKLGKFIGEQVQKFAATKAANAEAQMTTSVSGLGQRVTTTSKPAPTAVDIGKYAGIMAAIGLALGALGTALAAIVTGFLSLRWWQMPLVVLGVMLLVSGPSLLIAWFKLRSRTLAPLLDANGWAVNARARINIPFGTALTQTPRLPEGAERSVTDPFAEKEHPWTWYAAIGTLLFILLALWSR